MRLEYHILSSSDGRKYNEKSFKELESLSKQIRRCIVDTIANAQKGHLGGALSSVDILTYSIFQ